MTETPSHGYSRWPLLRGIAHVFTVEKSSSQFCQAHSFPIIWRLQGIFSNTPSSDLCRILASIFPIPQQAFQHLEEQEGLLLWWTWLLCGLVPTELVCNPPNTKTAASAVELQKIISSDWRHNIQQVYLASFCSLGFFWGLHTKIWIAPPDWETQSSPLSRVALFQMLHMKDSQPMNHCCLMLIIGTGIFLALFNYCLAYI